MTLALVVYISTALSGHEKLGRQMSHLYVISSDIIQCPSVPLMNTWWTEWNRRNTGDLKSVIFGFLTPFPIDNFAHRTEVRKALAKDKEWQEQYLIPNLALIDKQESEITYLVPWCKPEKPPKEGKSSPLVTFDSDRENIKDFKL